jgi:hypothetical protein
MRRAIWMALAFMGTAPLVALAQQNTGAAPAASPSGAASIDRGQDTTATQTPGSPGQQSAGSIGTAQGQPATGGNAETQGTTGQTEGTGGAGGAGMGTGGTGTGTGGTGVSGSSGGGTGTGSGGSVGGQSAMQQGPMGSDAMQRELSLLRQRVASLEAEVDALRGTGGAGTGGDTGTPDTSDIQVQGPVTVATAVFDGRVVDITRKHIDIVDTSDGTFYRLTVDDQTRAFVGPDLKRIPVDQLSEGTQVRTSFALISGVEHARNIVTRPQRAQQQQGQPQRQQRRGTPPRQTPRQ